jgi:hypothetical protein
MPFYRPFPPRPEMLIWRKDHYNEDGVEVFNFGKYKTSGRRCFKKDLGYYGWMMNGEFLLRPKCADSNSLRMMN